MSEAFLQNLLAVAAGWLLATATQYLTAFSSRYADTRRLFTKLYRMLSDILIEIETNEAMKSLGMVRTVEGVFELDDSWIDRLPPYPPSVPEGFAGLVKPTSWRTGSWPESKCP